MRPALILAASILLLPTSLGSVAGCGGAPTEPQAPAPPESDARAETKGDTQPADDKPSSAPPLTSADCAELIAQIVELAVAEEAAAHPELPPPTEGELEAMRDQLSDELKPRCVGSERGIFDCAMQATTRDELVACE